MCEIPVVHELLRFRLSSLLTLARRAVAIDYLSAVNPSRAVKESVSVNVSVCGFRRR
jgi:hypothetical protein